METRAIIVAVIVLMFWLAPKPNLTEAHQTPRTEVARVVTTPDDPRITIKPYVRPTSVQAK